MAALAQVVQNASVQAVMVEQLLLVNASWVEQKQNKMCLFRMWYKAKQEYPTK